jgi:arylformamidase
MRLGPVGVVCGAAGRPPKAQAERFAERARALGGPARVVDVPLTHAEINERLGADEALTAAVDDFVASLVLAPHGETPQRSTNANSRIASDPPKLE